MREEEMKAAVVIFPDAIGYASPELNHAVELACGQLHEFVNYLQRLDPELKRHEATIMAAAILQGLPQLFENNPAIMAAVKGECEAFRKNRT
ncbi:hypothetical protein H6G93_17970 [Nostoc sp. FACHB-973]|nr:hypothetical protein [Nostoc sp. FACHB-973]